MNPLQNDNDAQPLSTRSEQSVAMIDQLITQTGGKADSFEGELIRETIQTVLRFIRDDADTGELKLINRSLKELRYGLNIFRKYQDSRKISIFGSARTPEDHPDYLACVEFARLLAEDGWMVITGAGDGIMKAGHVGAGREQSMGVGIRLPFETNANSVIDGDEKLIIFRHFFTRKLMFVMQADALALYPGGFGTLDEGFEVLTLIQTGKATSMPVVLVDPPDGNYWKAWDDYIQQALLNNGWISDTDQRLYYVTNDARDAYEHVARFYRNYHSQRFVNDQLVLRLNKPLSPEQVVALNGEFTDIVVEGKMTCGEALPEEEEHRELPRLSFVFDRKNYGRLRMLIDRINELN